MKKRCGPALLVLLLSASAAFAGVSVTHAPSADFSNYRTYDWETGTPARRPATQDWIVAAVDRCLEAGGFHKTESTPDFYVATHALVDEHTIEELSRPERWEFLTGVSSVDAYDLGAGTLVVDVLDATTGAVVWRGVATATVNGSAKKVEKKVEKRIRKLLERFPPG